LDRKKRYERETNVTLSCGLGSKIGDLVYAGVSKGGKTTCKGILKDPKNFKSGFSDTCYY